MATADLWTFNVANAPTKDLTTVDMSLRYLLMPQLRGVLDAGGDVVGISAPGPWVDELEATGVRFRALESRHRSILLVISLLDWPWIRDAYDRQLAGRKRADELPHTSLLAPRHAPRV